MQIKRKTNRTEMWKEEKDKETVQKDAKKLL